jgi:hypothetical protein
VGLARRDYRLEGKRARLRFLEKGNKEQLVWLHHQAEADPRTTKLYDRRKDLAKLSEIERRIAFE